MVSEFGLLSTLQDVFRRRARLKERALILEGTHPLIRNPIEDTLHGNRPYRPSRECRRLGSLPQDETRALAGRVRRHDEPNLREIVESQIAVRMLE